MNLTSGEKNLNSPKNALITGAAKRVGRAISLALAADGWNVALHHNSTDIREVSQQCQKLGAKVCTIKADLNNLSDLKNVIPAANSQLGEISLLINNASIFEKCSFEDTDEDIFDRHMNINFKAPFFLCQDFAKQTQNGQIINISDTRTTDNKTTYFAYLNSKKSLSNLTKMLAVELSPSIRTNEIALGACDMEQSYDRKYLEKRVSQTPLGVAIDLNDITNAILYLSKQTYLTGQTLYIDSGENLIG